jgi:two-component system phosphate regulon response regulator PhoB
MAVETLVLVVDPDPVCARLLRAELEAHGLRVLHVADGAGALATVAKVHPDLVAVATQLPDGAGVELMQELHGQLDVPVLLLASDARDPELVRGLALGADDALAKPFDPLELAARVTAVIRRARRAAGGTPVADGLQLDFRQRVARVDGRPVALGVTDWRILELLVTSAGRTVAVAELQDAAWGPGSDADEQRLRVVMSRLRAKLGTAGWAIETVRGAGYRFERRRSTARATRRNPRRTARRPAGEATGE